jgi:hypothetical protein
MFVHSKHLLYKILHFLGFFPFFFTFHICILCIILKRKHLAFFFISFFNTKIERSLAKIHFVFEQRGKKKTKKIYITLKKWKRKFAIILKKVKLSCLFFFAFFPQKVDKCKKNKHKKRVKTKNFFSFLGKKKSKKKAKKTRMLFS